MKRKKITKSLGFELELRISTRKRRTLLTLLGDDANGVTISSFYLIIPTIVPSPETQMMYDEALTKSFTLSFESWTTDSKPINTGKDF